MDMLSSYGLHLFKKDSKERPVLKELLQLMKSHSPGKTLSFAYVEAKTSLIPELSLWENLQLVVGVANFKDFKETLKPECLALVNLLKNPNSLAKDSEPWECFTISLVKGLVGNGHLLVDMNEDLLSPFMVQNFKKTLMKVAEHRQVFLASATTGLWLDCAQSLISRKDFNFVAEKFDTEYVKRHWVA